LGQTIYLKEFTTDKLKDPFEEKFRRYLLETDRGKSVKAYCGDLNRFISWVIEKYNKFNPKAVTVLDIVEYRSFLQEQPGRKGKKAPATVNRALASLKIFFGWLVKQGEIRSNPAEDVKLVASASKPAPKWLDRNQQASLVRTVREHGTLRDEALIGLMLHAGLRVSEVCSLTREDIEISERKGHVIVRHGKGNKYREAPLNKTIRKILLAWLEMNPSGPLFPNKKKGKTQITVRGVFDLVAEYAYLAKLEAVTPHTLRHTFCKNLIDAGVPIDQVAMMAGHSNLNVTKRYTTPSMADLQAAVERTAWE
jgi:site-specific recombinase XerD